MEALFDHRRNGRAGSQNKILYLSFFDAKMAEILAQHINLSITNMLQFSLSKKTWKNNVFSEAALNCLAKCFGQPPPDALVKTEITLASTGNVRPYAALSNSLSDNTKFSFFFPFPNQHCDEACIRMDVYPADILQPASDDAGRHRAAAMERPEQEPLR